jgi:transcriptional regulator with XRE-family HTH domain
MESIKDIVAKNCKRLLNRSVNLAEVSRLMRIHPSTISRWKSGDHAPELDKLDRLAEILGVNVSEFFKDDRPEPTRSQVGVFEAIRRFQSVPEDIYDLAVKLGPTHDVWRTVNVALTDAIHESNGTTPPAAPVVRKRAQ